jgi:hypothetical protein
MYNRLTRVDVAWRIDAAGGAGRRHRSFGLPHEATVRVDEAEVIRA